jgi:lysophospholipase L1-like esterase
MPLHSRRPLTCVLPLLAWGALTAGDPAALAQGGSPAAPASPTARLELRARDRIVLVGNTLAERQQHFNHFETSLLTRFAALDLTIRNLGWSGDTPALQPRPLNFGDAATHLTAQRADVMLVFFGLNESFGGAEGLAGFERDLSAYLEAQLAARYNGTSAPRVVLVSPIAHERLARLEHVDVEARNRELARYTDAMRKVAATHGVPFADVFTPTREAMASASAPLTINGIHLNESGDRVFADILISALGLGVEPLPAAVLTTAGFVDLRELVREKNQLFFYRFRPLNAEYVVGRRLDPFGSVNFPPEMKRLDAMVAGLDKRIWKQARTLARTAPAPARPAASSAQRGPA